MFVIHLRLTFHMPSLNGSLVINIRAKGNYCKATVLMLHILQRITNTTLKIYNHVPFTDSEVYGASVVSDPCVASSLQLQVFCQVNSQRLNWETARQSMRIFIP
jgi:hypothetical protein